MARIQLELPDRFVFSTSVDVHIGYINYGNHLDNAAVLALVSEARVRFLGSLGYGELDVEGLRIAIADTAVQYRSEASHGEVLRIDLTADDLNKYGCDLVWRMAEATTGREVARGKTGIVFIDPATERPTAVPARFLARAFATTD